MDKTLNAVAVLIDKLKIKEIIVTLMVTCIVILFSPDKFIGTLGLVEWRNEYRTEIGGVFLSCAVLCLSWLITWIFNKICRGDGAAKRVSRAYLKKLISTDEKEFLIKHYFNIDTKEFNSCGKIDMTSGYWAPLQNAMIVYPATKVGHGVNRWAFNLQPDVRIFLNKAVKKGKITVSSDGKHYKWSL